MAVQTGPLDSPETTGKKPDGERFFVQSKKEQKEIHRRKISTAIAGSVLAAGVAAGLFGAGSAQAAPGISYQNGSGNEIGFGDHGSGRSADAKASGANSQALAINTGLNLFSKFPSSAKADGDGATAVSIDGYTSVTGSNSHGFAALGQTNINGADNNAVTVAGKTDLFGSGNIHGNFVVNAAGVVQQNGKSPQAVTAAGEVSVSVCGTSVSGQAAHITVSPAGLC